MRYFRIILIALVLGVATYILSLNMFMGLKIKGYSYLFYADRPYDIVIKHATILDGTGENEKFRGDIAIRDGVIAGVGYINPQDSPVFDAGGLTVIPAPIPLEKDDDQALEHLFATSYPRYPARNIYLQEGLYQGLNLEQAAEMLGTTSDEAFKQLRENPDVNPLALLVEIPCREDQTGLQEYLARLTGYRAAYYNLEDKGVIRAGAYAQMYFFQNRDYEDKDLERLFRQGQVPPPVYTITGSRFNQ